MGFLLIVSGADFFIFVSFLDAVGARGHCCMAVESRLEALRFVRSPQAMRASRANPRPSGLMALDLARSRQNYVRGVALNQEPPKLHHA